MRKIFTFLAVVMTCCVISTESMAQCAAPNPGSSFDLSRHYGLVTPAGQCNTNPTSIAIGFGEYATVSLVSGRTYRFSTCGGTTFDSELEVWQFQAGFGGYPGSSTVLAFNDDACGLQSTVQFVSPGTGRAIVGLDLWSGLGVSCTNQWSATGGSSAIMTLREVDVTAPNAVCSNATVNLNASGSATISAGTVDGGSSDNCGIVSSSVSPSSFSCANIGGNTVTLTVTDAEGNSDQCTATVTVNDVTGPTVSCFGSITINTSSDGTGNCLANPTGQGQGYGISDNCPGNINVNELITDQNGSVLRNFTFSLAQAGYTPSINLPTGVNTFVITPTDGNGNTGSSCTYTVTVVDDEAPSAVCQNATVQLDGSGNGSLAASAVDGGSSDNCGITSSSVSPSSFTCADLGANSVTLTVSDAAGNSSSCTATVTVEDNIPPVIGACPADIDVNAVPLNCNQLLTWTPPSFTDNCGTAGATVTATIPLNAAGFTLLQVGTYVNTYTITDANGNSSSCSFNITIRDVEDPILTGCPTTVTASADAGVCQTRVTWGPITGSDNCPGTIVTATHNSGDVFAVGTTTVTYTATDPSGNNTSCSFDVVVTDDEDPVLTGACPANIALNNDAGLCSAVATFSIPGATDNCPGVTVAATPPSGTAFPVGNTTVTVTATDAAGNTASCSFDVDVTDNEAPVASCQNITVQLDASGNASITDADVDAGSSDNCGIVSSVASPTSFGCSNVGANTVTLTVTDAAGNSSSCTSTVMVQDNVAPVALCQDVTVQLDASGNGSTTAAAVDAGSSDACGIASISLDQTAFTCADVGANSVVLTVTDNNGNVSTCGAQVTVEDNVAPNAVCQNTTVQLDAAGNGSITPADVDGGSTDACGIASLSVAPNTFGCGDVGANTVTLTVTDVNGNVSTCTATATVEDNVAPNAVCVDVTVQLDASGNGSITTGDVDGGSTDACGIASLSVAPNTFGCSNVGANTATLTVTDVNGNVSTCTSNVTVEDNVAPTAVCVDFTSQLDASGNSAITAGDVDGGSTDACGIATLTVSPNTFTCAEVGANPVTLTVTDVNGNTSTCAATVTVEDNVPPVALCQDVTVQLDASGNASITAGDVDAGSSDACGIASTAVSPSTFDCSNVSTTPTASGLIISEYVEGSSFNKYIEIFNGTGASVNLGDYQLLTYFNGSFSPASFNLSGTLANGQTEVYRNSSATVYGGAATTAFVVNFNGDDAVALFNTVSGNFEDIFGTIGQDPGSQWNVAGNETQNQTLRRLGTVTSGNTSNAFGFPSLGTEWTEHAINDVSDLGSHSLTSSPTLNAVTLTVTDVNGNVSTCSADVTVQDNVAPTAVCQNVTVQLDANGNGSITAADVDGGSTDNCAIESLEVSQEDFDCSDVGSNTVTLTVTDVNGNVSTCTATVDVQDNVAPTAVCQNITVQLDATGNASITASDVDGGSSDACGIQSLAVDINSFTCADVTSGPPVPQNIWINEIHYDNSGGDVGEKVEVVSTFAAGDYAIYKYNGSFGGLYGDDLLSTGSVTTTAGGYFIYTLNYPANGLQNGSPDGIALVDGSGVVVEFLSYEGTFTAINGPANGMTSTDIGVSESSGSNVGESLQKAGSGNSGGDFTWTSASAETPGAANNGQTLNALPAPTGVTVTLTVTDNNGNVSTCSSIVTVEDNVPPVITCPADITVPNLVDNCNQVVAWADATATDNCDANPTITQTGGPTTNLFGFAILNVGTYTVSYSATDQYGNTSTCDMNIAVVDTQAPVVNCPADITVTANDPATCTAAATWATPLSNDNCNVVSISSSAVSGAQFPVGVNTVTYSVVDGAGNTGSCSFTVTVNVTPLSLSASVTDVACAGDGSGAVDLTVDGGCMPYSYAWSNGATTEDLSGVGAGTYDVTVTDATGQTATLSATVNEPTALSVSLTPSLFNCGFNISCNGANDGTITISTSGGTPPYTALWNTGDLTVNGTLVSIGTGTYMVTVEDANGCITSASVTMSEPAALTASIASTQNVNGFDISCNGGSDGGVDLTIAGGCAPYSYNWDNGATTEDLSGVGAGTYKVEVTDANGCTVRSEITLVEPSALQIRSSIRTDYNGSPISCPGASDAKFGIRVQGGVPPYTYLWNTGDTGDRLINYPAGTYTVTATDANGCTITDTIVVNEPAAFCHTIEVITQSVYNGADVSCNGASNAWVDLIPCGGTPRVSGHPCPYDYQWSHGPTSEDLANVGAGTYTVTITDLNGCSSVMSVTVSEPDTISAPAVITNDATCTGVGAIDITAAGGTPGYSYSWSTGATTEDVTGLTAGRYYVTVTDANGCSNVFEYIVTDPCGTPIPMAAPNGPAIQATSVNGSGGSSSKSVEADEDKMVVETALMSRFDLKAYPNPFASKLTLEYTAPEMGSKVSLVVMNSIGQVVYHDDYVSENEGTANKEVNFDGLSSGVYYVTITTGDLRETLKVIKQD